MNENSSPDRRPVIDRNAYVSTSASVSGDVVIHSGANIWHHAVLRGDLAGIVVGNDTNIQDNAVIHVNDGMPTTIGARVTIGHGAIVHAATVEDDALVGMGAIVMDGAVVGTGALVGAGTLVPPGKTVPPGMLVVGNPMRIVREVTAAERESHRTNVERYVALARESLGVGEVCHGT
jgi:carbonic anhydrase/acetyltransferase-like protein (isoleucine patch superfamily)